MRDDQYFWPVLEPEVEVEPDFLVFAPVVVVEPDFVPMFAPVVVMEPDFARWPGALSE